MRWPLGARANSQDADQSQDDVTLEVAAGQRERQGEEVADRADWHDVAKLVKRGCPAALAVTIIE